MQAILKNAKASHINRAKKLYESLQNGQFDRVMTEQFPIISDTWQFGLGKLQLLCKEISNWKDEMLIKIRKLVEQNTNSRKEFWELWIYLMNQECYAKKKE
jgi:hypothetical protein